VRTVRVVTRRMAEGAPGFQPAGGGNLPARWRASRQRRRRAGMTVGRPRRFRLLESSSPPHSRQSRRVSASASTRTAMRPCRTRPAVARPAAGGRAAYASVTGPGQHSRMIRRRPIGLRRASRHAVRAESASSRNGPRRCLNRRSRARACGAGAAATPATVPVACAIRPPPRTRRAARRSSSFRRGVTRPGPPGGRAPPVSRLLRESRRPVLRGRPAACRAEMRRAWPESARPAARRSSPR